MTKRDYELIAAVIRRSVEHENGNTTKRADNRREAFRDIALSFSTRLASDNPRFDSSAFLSACEI